MEINTEAINSLFENLGLTNNLIISLIVVIVLNIIVIIVRFYLDLRLKDRDQHIYRANLINSKSIEVQEEIFKRMDKLSLFNRDEDQLLLKDLQELQSIVSARRIYLNKKSTECINKILDYYRILLTDFKRKDIRIENKNLDEYIKIFNTG